MLYHLSQFLTPYCSVFNVVHYVSFRAIAALISALLLSCIFGDWFIMKSQLFFRSKAREWTPDNHKLKDNMPTMGGLFIIAIVVLNVLLWNDLTRSEVWIFLCTILSFGYIGFLDDWAKIRQQKGISARTKSSLQIIFATSIALLLLYSGIKTILMIPFFKSVNPDLGFLFIPWVIFLLVGASNAVNLTDGLDGLAINSLIPNFGLFAIISYLAGNLIIASYLKIPFAHSSELSIICAILVGASLGFLWFNAYPAQIFMGDVGSLALGATLAYVAIVSKHELILPISGGLFVIETLSVIVQVLSYKFLGYRVFKMAPIHHHYELLGWPESKITVRFGIISLVLCLLALITIKIR